MLDQEEIYIDEPETIEIKCRQMNYELIIKDTAYCGAPKENCMYKADEVTKETNMYRCLSLDKQYN